MGYAAAKTTLQGVVNWLRSEDNTDSGWKAQTDSAQECLVEMMRILETIEIAQTTAPIRDLGVESRAENLNRTIPHVRTMVRAMREHDRATALTHGEMGFRWL
jgi:hypothetical protein